MYKMPIKVAAVLLSVCLLTSLSACNGSGNSSAAQESNGGTQTQPSSGGNTSTDTKDPLGKYEEGITIATARVLESNSPFIDESSENYKSITDNVWYRAYQEQLGITLKYNFTAPGDQYDTKWNLAMASGELPDAGRVSKTIYKQLLSAGLVEDMTDYYEGYASTLYKEYNEADDGVTIRQMTSEGRLYGLPENGIQPDSQPILYIRKDWLDKVNMPVPKTIEELEATMKAFVGAKLGGDVTYGLSIAGDLSSMEGVLNGYGAYNGIWLKDEQTGKLKFSTIQPEMKEPLLKLQEMYKAGLIRQDFAVSEDVAADIAAGKVGIFFGGYWLPLNEMKSSMVNDPTAEWLAVEPPTANGLTYVGQTSASPGAYMFVKKGVEHPEAVVKLMNLDIKLREEQPLVYDTTAEGLQAFVLRFDHQLLRPWKNLTAHNKIIKALENNDASQLNGEEKGYYDMIKVDDANGKAFGLVFGNDSAFTLIGQWKEKNQFIMSSYEGLPTVTQESSETILNESLLAAIQKVVMGDDISTFDKAVEAWKAGGGNQITEEVNEWYAKNQ